MISQEQGERPNYHSLDEEDDLDMLLEAIADESSHETLQVDQINGDLPVFRFTTKGRPHAPISPDN